MGKTPLREIGLKSLKVGMHVTKLDISWMDSPFLTHSRRIKSEKDIALLKKAGVKTIVIDPNKGVDVDIVEEEPVEALTTEENQQEAEDISSPEETSPQAAPSAPLTAAQKEKRLENEITAALAIRSQLKKTISNLYNDLSAGSAIDSAELSPMIDDTLDSLERHNQALLNLAHISKRSQKLADHTFSTFCIALNIAQQQEYSKDEIDALGIAALVHEAGWTPIPIQLMGKRIAYTKQEVALIEKHVDIGLKSLSKSDIPELSRRIVLEHHERCDGEGYPNKLSSDTIHPMSKLFSVVDRYDELVNQLNDKPGMLPTNALRQLYVGAQKNIYDPTCVGQLIALLGVYPISSVVKLSTGAIGVVREVPADNHLLPLVEVRIDEKGKTLNPSYFVDLASEEALNAAITIDSVVDPAKSSENSPTLLTLTV